MRPRSLFASAFVAVLVVVLASPGFAVSMSGPTGTVSGWTLASTGTNTISGGTLTVSALLSPYTVTVTADKTRMSEYSGGGYVSNGKTLSDPLNVTATLSTPHCLVPGVGATAIIGTSSTLATGTGLAITGCSDTYTITLSQATSVADPALVPGHTYHISLTYTVSGGL
ncbi:MAG: hypothetical protein ACXVQV_12300 [Actinomycetota bacterium]